MPPGEEAVPDSGAALGAALADESTAGAFLRASPDVRLRAGGDASAAAASHGVAEAPVVAAAHLAACPLPPLAHLAAPCGAAVALAWRGAPPAPDGAAQLRCTLHGQALRFAGGAAEVPLGATSAHVLRPSNMEGAALLHRSDAAGALDAGPPRVLLLTADARIAAEVQASADALLMSCETDDGAARALLEADVYALGLALRPGCAPGAAARAAAAALGRGWRAAARRVLRSLAAGGAHPAAALLPGGVSLLHVAASTGAAWAVRAVLEAPAGAAAEGARPWARLARLLRGPTRDARWLLGSPAQRCGTEAAATPLHAAAAALAVAATSGDQGSQLRLESYDAAVDDALSALELLLLPPEGAAAWLGVAAGAGAGGATPAELARGALGGAERAPAAARLRRLDAAARRRVAAGARAADAASDALRTRHGVAEPASQVALAPAMLAAMDTASMEADAVAVAAALLRCAADAAGVAPAADLRALGVRSSRFPRAAAAATRARRLALLALAPAAADALPLGDVAAAEAEAALPEELRAYPAWLLQRSRWVVRLWAANIFWYYIRATRDHRGGDDLATRLARAAADAPPTPGGALALRTWPEAQPLYWTLVGTWQLLAVQLPLLAALLWEITPPEVLPARLPAAARRAGVVAHLATHHAAHYLLAGLADAWLLAQAAPPAVSRVVWPTRAGAVFAAATLLSHMGLPLPCRAALPLLALRAALPLAAAAGAPVWLHTPRAGLAMQLAAVALAALMVLWRDAVLRPAFRAERAAALAEAAAMADAAQGQRKSKDQ